MRYWVEPHAARAYVERVKPAMEVGPASMELGRLCAMGRRCGKPWWADHPGSGRYFLELSDGIIAVIAPPLRPDLLPTVLTVLCRAGHDRAHREAINRRRAQRRHARQLRKRRRDRSRPELGEDFALSEDALQEA